MSLCRAAIRKYMSSTVDNHMAGWKILGRNMVRRKATWHEARPDEEIDGSLSEGIMKVMDGFCPLKKSQKKKT